MAIVVIPVVPKGLYEIGPFVDSTLTLQQSGNVDARNDFDESQQWIVSPAAQGGNRYSISNLNTSQALEITFESTNTPASWSIDTQFGGLVLGVSDDPYERVITLTAGKDNKSALWPVSGIKAQRWSFYSAIPGWIRTHAKIDTSKSYYIKNLTTGRCFSYIGNGQTGYAVVDRTLVLGAPYSIWNLSINAKDQGMILATTHASRPKITQSLTMGPNGDSFRFMPVPGNQGYYFIGLGVTDNPPNVVVGQAAEDNSKPGSTGPFAIDNKYQMWQLLDAATYTGN